MEECVRCTIEALAISKVYWGEYLRHKGERATIDLLNVIGELKHAENHIIPASREIHDEIRRVRMELEECIGKEKCPVGFEEKIDKILLKLTGEKCGEKCPIEIKTGSNPGNPGNPGNTWIALLVAAALIWVFTVGGSK
jgi:hypothetical protein